MRRHLFWTLVAGLLLVYTAACQEEKKQDNAQQDKTFPLFAKRCSLCHSIERPLSYRKPAKDWRATVQRMMEKKLDWINQQEMEQIISFLSRVRGKEEP